MEIEMKPVHDLTPIKCIRRKCVECMGGDPERLSSVGSAINAAIDDCVSVTYPLWKFRTGKHPDLKGRETPATRVQNDQKSPSRVSVGV